MVLSSRWRWESIKQFVEDTTERWRFIHLNLMPLRYIWWRTAENTRENSSLNIRVSINVCSGSVYMQMIKPYFWKLVVSNFSVSFSLLLSFCLCIGKNLSVYLYQYAHNLFYIKYSLTPLELMNNYSNTVYISSYWMFRTNTTKTCLVQARRKRGCDWLPK